MNAPAPSERTDNDEKQILRCAQDDNCYQDDNRYLDRRFVVGKTGFVG
jgi:hypothetical protein